MSSLKHGIYNMISKNQKNNLSRVRLNPINCKWFIDVKEMLKIGKFDWVVDSGPFDTKFQAEKNLESN